MTKIIAVHFLLIANMTRNSTDLLKKILLNLSVLTFSLNNIFMLNGTHVLSYAGDITFFTKSVELGTSTGHQQVYINLQEQGLLVKKLKLFTPKSTLLLNTLWCRQRFL